MKMRLSWILVGLSFAALCIIATGCYPFHATTRMGFSGTVIDAENRVPLPDARISFEGATNETQMAISAADGSFSVPQLKHWQIRFIPGDYFLDRMIGGTVRIEHSGYEPGAVNISPIGPAQRYHTSAQLGFIPLKPLLKTPSLTSLSTTHPVTSP